MIIFSSKSNLRLALNFLISFHVTHQKEATVIDFLGCQQDSDCKIKTSSCCDTFSTIAGGSSIPGGKICHRKVEKAEKILLGDKKGKFIQKCAER